MDVIQVIFFTELCFLSFCMFFQTKHCAFCLFYYKYFWPIIHQENQRRAVMDSLMAAQHYCLATTCRRKFLLDHFGEKYSADKCGMAFVSR